MNAEPQSPSTNTRLALFTLSGNRCAFPDCEARMWLDGSVLGEVCHIHGQRPGSSRFIQGLSPVLLHGISNLILLCPLHHKLVDDNPETYSADWLRQTKQAHEARAASTPSSMLARLIEILAPEVPDSWEDRPSAPTFRLGMASSMPSETQRRYELTIREVDGGDVGGLECRITHGDNVGAWYKPRLREPRQWIMEHFTVPLIGAPFDLELRFWWEGSRRLVRHHWEAEAHLQDKRAELEYGQALD